MPRNFLALALMATGLVALSSTVVSCSESSDGPSPAAGQGGQSGTDASTGGGAGASGTSGSGGAAGAAGSTGSGGSAGTAGASGTGGAAGAGGSVGDAGCVPGQTQSCYSGADGTSGVGECKSGLSTCASDGLTWSACVGEVVPQQEQCATVADEDCDGVTKPCTGTPLWAKAFGDAQTQQGAAVAIRGGRVAVAGTFQGSIELGGGALTSAGGGDVFLGAFDDSGQHLWSKRFGDAQAQTVAAIVLHSNLSVIVVGDYAGTIDLGGGALVSAGSTDMYVAKFDAAGTHLWSRSLGAASAQSVRGVAVDAVGSVIIAGSLSGSTNFGCGALVSAGLTDAFLAKLDADGACVWSKRFGDAQAQGARAVAVDSGGNITMVGDQNGTVDFGAGALTSAGGTDVFVARFDANGAVLWSKRFGDASDQSAASVAVGANGDIVLVGNAAGSADFGGGALTSAGDIDPFIVQFTASGSHTWSRMFGSAGAENARSVAIDPSGGVLLTGDFGSAINFGGASLVSAGSTDVMVARFDATGNHQWSARFGDASLQTGSGIAADGSAIALVGSFVGQIDFGKGAVVSSGLSDAFLAVLSP